MYYVKDEFQRFPYFELGTIVIILEYDLKAFSNLFLFDLNKMQILTSKPFN